MKDSSFKVYRKMEIIALGHINCYKISLTVRYLLSKGQLKIKIQVPVKNRV